MAEEKKSPLREITQPFVDLVHAPRALWGINLAYVIEGMVYFGMLGYLAIYFSDFVFQGVEHADERSHNSVMVLTAGITIAMFFLGAVADKWGVRFALVSAFAFMLIGRIAMAGAPNVFGLEPARPGVVAGDKVDLHVTKMDTIDGVKVIADASVLANDNGASGPATPLAVDLSAGDGLVPDASFESRLVQIRNARIVEGEAQDWQIEYGSAPVTSRLLAHAAEEIGLCVGATLSVQDAYVTRRNEEGDEFVIRSHWAEDVTSVDVSGCEEAPERESAGSDDDLKSHSRWSTAQPSEAAQAASPTTITEIRALEDGPANVLLKGVNVTYVRNGGYFLQADREGPGIRVFVDPMWSSLHLLTMLGICLVVFGYGMYQPAAYAGVRLFTTPKTAAMGFAMLYALMNLGGWLPSFAFLLRDEDFLGLGISGVFWVYTAFTLCGLFVTIFILSKRTVATAIATAKEETAAIKAAEGKKGAEVKENDAKPDANRPAQTNDTPSVPFHLWLLAGAALFAIFMRLDAPLCYIVPGALALAWVALVIIPPTGRWVARHPLADPKFAFFIFALIPVQTLFTYNWLVLPQYISRAFEGWIGDYFEIAANANPILIFIAVPIITAMTQKAKVYNMMIYGTFIMAAPAFLLVIGPYAWTLFLYILIMTIGEAMWQPRFMQYAAEIAPPGRTGQYMGVAQLPWFLTKVIVPWLYSGWMMDRYCPAEGEQNTQVMWLIYACIAMCSTVMLVIAKPWVGKDFKTKAG